jgi:hypothetical protein
MSNTEQTAVRLAEVEELIEQGEERAAEIFAEGYAQFGASFSLYAYDPDSCRELAQLRAERRGLFAALGLTN